MGIRAARGAIFSGLRALRYDWCGLGCRPDQSSASSLNEPRSPHFGQVALNRGMTGSVPRYAFFVFAPHFSQRISKKSASVLPMIMIASLSPAVRMVEVPDGIMVEEIVRLVELGLDLDEVRRLDAKLGGEDVVVRIVEVVPGRP
jgi:hypothetical protein